MCFINETYIATDSMLQGVLFLLFTKKFQLLSISLLSFSANVTRRHSFWILTIGGTFYWLSLNVVNQK